MKQKRTSQGTRKGCIVARIERADWKAEQRTGWAL